MPVTLHPHLVLLQSPSHPLACPALFIYAHSHSSLSRAKYLAKLVENHRRDEVSKQTDIKLMKILIFQEVPEPLMSKAAS